MPWNRNGRDKPGHDGTEALSFAAAAAPGRPGPCTASALAAAAIAGAAHRRRAEIVEPDRDADMGVGRADAVGRIERDPAEVGDIGLGPGVAGVLVGDAVGAVEIAADVAGRNAEACARPR